MSGLQTTSIKSRSTQESTSWRRDVIFLALFLAALFFILLGSRPLFVPDEGRYAEIAREMAAANDYVTPYLDGIKYFEKPVLYYWLCVAAIKTAGLGLWPLRSVNALLGLLGCMLTYLTARTLYGRTTGLLAALILGTSPLYFLMAHMISLDLPVSVFLTGSLYGFILGALQVPGSRRRIYFWASATSAALAVLTKGLIGLVFPACIAGAWMLLWGSRKHGVNLKNIYLPTCIIIFLLIAAPWHILVGMRNPEFYYFYFIQQHFLRYTSTEVGHYQPAWFFSAVLIAGFAPWIAFLPQALARIWRSSDKNSADNYFLLWAVFVFVFFSISQSKLIPYILPMFPPLAILVARYLQLAITEQRWRGIVTGYACLLPFILVSAAACCALTYVVPVVNARMANLFLYPACLTLLSGAAATGILIVRREIYPAIAATFLTIGLFLVLFIGAFQFLDTRSIRSLAATLKPMLHPQDEVVTFNQYYQDLPFYLEQRVSILNWRNELSYGIQHQPVHDWMIDDNKFWQKWRSSQRLFVLADVNNYTHLQSEHPQDKFYLLGQTSSTVLISNYPQTTG